MAVFCLQYLYSKLFSLGTVKHQSCFLLSFAIVTAVTKVHPERANGENASISFSFH